MPVNELLRWADMEGARFTRIDYAIDCVGAHYIPPKMMLNALKRGEIDFNGDLVGEHAKTPKKASSAIPVGITAEMGVRNSPRFVRFYDKAAEQNILGVSWARLEIEMKKQRAQQYATQCQFTDWKVAGRGQMFDYFRPSLSASDDILRWYRDLFEAIPHEAPPQIPRKEVRADKYIEDMVLPFLRNHGQEISDVNLLRLRAIVNGEIWARERIEREHDTDLTVNDLHSTIS